MDIEVRSDKENLLFGRREVECIFRGSYGHFSRIDAVQALSKKIKTTHQKVFVISIHGQSGSRDAEGLFYIYDDENNAKKDIPDYILTRNKPNASKPEKSETSSKADEAEKAKPITDEEVKSPVVEAGKPSEQKSETKLATESPKVLNDEKAKFAGKTRKTT
jgi:small subunit ribosomal protein S24e|tara:strand:+ start:7590 stop:8075 length:486 start_codon:yes stop_codon:yes gene_type:complete